MAVPSAHERDNALVFVGVYALLIVLMISERTKAGLAAAKARGKRLGGLNDAGITRRQEAIARAEALRPLLTEMEGPKCPPVPWRRS